MRARLILAFLPLLLVPSAPAWARGTLDEILPQIRAQHPGKLSDAEPWTDGEGNTHYRIKWMTPEGRIIYFDADPRSGRYSSMGGDEGNDWRSHRNRGDSDEGGRRGQDDGDDGGRRGHWNSDEGGSDSSDGGRGDWRGQGGSGGGDWRDHDRGGGDWGGQNGWRGGSNGGDNGGHHHHGNPQ